MTARSQKASEVIRGCVEEHGIDSKTWPKEDFDLVQAKIKEYGGWGSDEIQALWNNEGWTSIAVYLEAMGS